MSSNETEPVKIIVISQNGPKWAQMILTLPEWR